MWLAAGPSRGYAPGVVTKQPQTTDADPGRGYRDLPKGVLIFVGLLLCVSAVLNVIALLPNVAFLELTGLLLPGPYSILKVIQLLWHHHLYPLVVLVVGFSVLFPPLKIALATMSLVKPMTRAGRFRLLSVLGHLGRWSLLDVFVALLLLIITSKQSFTGSTVSFGLYAFIGAIVLSVVNPILFGIQRFTRHINVVCRDGSVINSRITG